MRKHSGKRKMKKMEIEKTGASKKGGDIQSYTGVGNIEKQNENRETRTRTRTRERDK